MAKRRTSGGRGTRRGAFLAGLVLGVVLAQWVFPMVTQWWREPAPETVASNPATSPRFDFYDILERGEEVVEETLAAVEQAASGAPGEDAAQRPADAGAQQPAATLAQPPADAAAQAATPAPATPAPQPAAPTPVATPGMYVLQLGAFTRQQDAESLKARLALVGMNARIQPVRIDRQTWFRVRVGPTSDLNQLNEDRARLQEHRFDSILIRFRPVQ